MITMKNPTPCFYGSHIFFLLFFGLCCHSQKTCPSCGSIEVPYPLSTGPNCGDPDYTLRCDFHLQKIFFDALNGSSYLVLKINASSQRIVVQPSPWLPGSCVTQDMIVSEGLWLNQSLPFNITSSNTIFFFNCSPRLLVSPLNCTPSSLCHQYLASSGHVDEKRALECASFLEPCCTFIPGGMPSAYKLRLHNSGCRAFRSILHLDVEKPANQWEEGLEIQWAPPHEPLCRAQSDCTAASDCLPSGSDGRSRCLCKSGFHWDRLLGTCLRIKKKSIVGLSIKLSVCLVSFFILAAVVTLIKVRKSRAFDKQNKLSRQREKMLYSSNGGRPARLFHLKEMKKATDEFSKERVLGSGGFGEVYKGTLEDGTVVAVKSAKLGNVKGTQQILNEVGILSQVNHKNLVRLLGCCVETEQPLMVYEYISNGTLHDHLHGKFATFLDWKTRLRIALQTAEALAYLHSAAYPPIYHRDVKSTNILLDDEFNAKVADFGLSRLALPGLSHVSTCAQGTLGYLDPEYFRNYQLTDKSDVYSYGVVLLELLTSQKAIDFTRDEDGVNLAIYVIQQVDNGSFIEAADKRLLGNDPLSSVVASVKQFLELALACLREKKVERPCMKDVVQELEYITQMMENPETVAEEGNSSGHELGEKSQEGSDH